MSLKIEEYAKDLVLAVVSLTKEHKESVSFSFWDCNCILHLVDKKYQHPLKEIVNKTSDKEFLLVSKQPRDEENYKPDIPVKTRLRLLVGTPIQEPVHYLFSAKNFHESDMEFTEQYLDISKLLKLEVKYAQYLASIYVQCIKQQKDLPEIWLLCDRDNPQGVDYIGIVPSLSTDAMITQINTVKISNEDYNEKIPSHSLSHQKKHHISFNQTNQAEVHCYAQYNIYGNMDASLSINDPDEPQSCISIEFAWNGVRDTLQPPPSSSNAVLNIFADPEDVQVILPDITNELNILVGLFSRLQKNLHKESVAENELCISDEEFNQTELKNNFLKFLEKLQLQSMGLPKESVTGSPSTTISFGIAEDLNREDLDHTESLWIFLMKLPSISQMIFCLDLILEQLFSREYQPVLHTNNQTNMANLMKEIVSCETDEERADIKVKSKNILTPTHAIQGIIDIGIDKLQNDYINYFIKQELVTKDLLEHFITKDSSASDKLQQLLKLHCVLSLVTLAISYARVNHNDLRQLVPAALKFYEKHPHTDIPVFSLSLPAFSAASSNLKNTCIRKFQPQTWVAAITSPNHCITMVQLNVKELSECFLEGTRISQENKNRYSITIANVNKVCI